MAEKQFLEVKKNFAIGIIWQVFKPVISCKSSWINLIENQIYEKTLENIVWKTTTYFLLIGKESCEVIPFILEQIHDLC